MRVDKVCVILYNGNTTERMKGEFVTKIKIALAAIAALLLAGCAQDSEAAAPAASETTVSETTTENIYLLVRGWNGQELLDSVFFADKNRPLPFPAEEDADFTYSDGKLVFSDGSYVQSYSDGNGNITALRFERSSAPADFSVYGVGFDASPDDIPDTVGIANSVVGGEDGPLTYSFYGGGITELTFVFEKRQLTEVYIAS